MIALKELDVVKLKNGRDATILEVFDGGTTFLVEIADDNGKTQDLPTIKAEEIVHIIWES